MRKMLRVMGVVVGVAMTTAAMGNPVPGTIRGITTPSPSLTTAPATEPTSQPASQPGASASDRSSLSFALSGILVSGALVGGGLYLSRRGR
jgi:hypothetical protein